MYPMIDIIIPVVKINRYIFESLDRILRLNYNNYGVIILPDRFDVNTEGKELAEAHNLILSNEDGDDDNKDTESRLPIPVIYRSLTKDIIIKLVATGRMGPAEKRDVALRYSTADILAFLDDDAYPRKDWLKTAVRHFDDPDVAAVGGPAITPASDSFYQKVSGAVFLSSVGGGYPERYWPIGKVRKVDDWPSVNLLVRRDIFEKIGGFNSAYWPGEDTKLCLDIIKLGKKIIYDPDVFVWHHRRKGLIRHLRQVGQYGLHRGFFAKRFPETSRRFKYFLPSFFVLFLAMGTPFIFMSNSLFRGLYYTGIGIYLLALAIALCQIQNKERNLAISIVSVLYIFLTHIWYGMRFLQGFLFTRELRSKLRRR